MLCILLCIYPLEIADLRYCLFPQNVLQYFETVHGLLKKGGLLIIHERTYLSPVRNDPAWFHPIAFTPLVMDIFLKKFNVIYRKDYDETSNGTPFVNVYYMGTKK